MTPLCRRSLSRTTCRKRRSSVPDEGGGYHLRWFTPAIEIDLCGHATVASAYVLMNHIDPSLTDVRFRSLSGELRVTREDDLYALDFPSRPPQRVDPPRVLIDALGVEPESRCGRPATTWSCTRTSSASGL